MGLRAAALHVTALFYQLTWVTSARGRTPLPEAEDYPSELIDLPEISAEIRLRFDLLHFFSRGATSPPRLSQRTLHNGLYFQSNTMTDILESATIDVPVDSAPQIEDIITTGYTIATRAVRSLDGYCVQAAYAVREAAAYHGIDATVVRGRIIPRGSPDIKPTDGLEDGNGMIHWWTVVHLDTGAVMTDLHSIHPHHQGDVLAQAWRHRDYYATEYSPSFPEVEHQIARSFGE